MKSFNPDAEKSSEKLKQFLSDETLWTDASNVCSIIYI